MILCMVTQDGKWRSPFSPFSSFSFLGDDDDDDSKAFRMEGKDTIGGFFFFPFRRKLRSIY